jgi:hypothetical protein
VIFKASSALTLAGFVLSACTASQAPSGTAETQAPVAVATASAKPDIVAAASGITLGTGWYRYETYAGQNFRWVDDDAKFIVHRTSGGKKTVSFDVEGGPGIGTPTFALHVRDKSGAEVASATVAGHERVSFNVPVESTADATYELHADGGGKPTPHENRILNFRVFSIDDQPSSVVAKSDIVAESDVRLGKNWGVLEQFAGQTFRWVDNDAEITIDATAEGQKNLLLDVAAGPAVESPNDFSLTLQDASGKTVQTQHVKAIGPASFALPLHKGTNTFRLHVASTGLPTKTDKRVLSFRVFKIRLT